MKKKPRESFDQPERSDMKLSTQSFTVFAIPRKSKISPKWSLDSLI